jgi:hypothetical protein
MRKTGNQERKWDVDCFPFFPAESASICDEQQRELNFQKLLKQASKNPQADQTVEGK